MMNGIKVETVKMKRITYILLEVESRGFGSKLNIENDKEGKDKARKCPLIIQQRLGRNRFYRMRLIIHVFKYLNIQKFEVLVSYPN